MICVGFSHFRLFCQMNVAAGFIHSPFKQVIFWEGVAFVWKSDLRQPFPFTVSKSCLQWEVTERSGKAASLIFNLRNDIL